MRMLLLLLWLQGFGPDIEVWRRLEAFAAFARTEIEDSALMNRWSGGFGAHGLSAYRIGIGFGRHPVRLGGVMLGIPVPSDLMSVAKPHGMGTTAESHH